MVISGKAASCLANAFSICYYEEGYGLLDFWKARFRKVGDCGCFRV